jgi:hypothetical protein
LHGNGSLAFGNFVANGWALETLVFNGEPENDQEDHEADGGLHTERQTTRISDQKC